MNDLIVDGNSFYARTWFAHQSAEEDLGIVSERTLNTAMTTFLSLLDPNCSRIGKHLDRTFWGWDGEVKKTDKSDRKEKPNAYYDTMKLFADDLEDLFGCKNVTLHDYEADDVVATAAFQSKADDVYVVSGDKDLTQLMCEGIHYYDLNTKCLLTRKDVCLRWRVKQPNQVALALAIVGDSIDNISGIKGWGPKKSEALFKSVKESMNFEESFATILRQVPENKRPEFLESLEATLLDTEIEAVTNPNPITLAEPNVIDEMGYSSEVVEFYKKVYKKYK